MVYIFNMDENKDTNTTYIWQQMFHCYALRKIDKYLHACFILMHPISLLFTVEPFRRFMKEFCVAYPNAMKLRFIEYHAFVNSLYYIGFISFWGISYAFSDKLTLFSMPKR